MYTSLEEMKEKVKVYSNRKKQRPTVSGKAAATLQAYFQAHEQYP